MTDIFEAEVDRSAPAGEHRTHPVDAPYAGPGWADPERRPVGPAHLGQPGHPGQMQWGPTPPYGAGRAPERQSSGFGGAFTIALIAAILGLLVTGRFHTLLSSVDGSSATAIDPSTGLPVPDGSTGSTATAGPNSKVSDAAAQTIASRVNPSVVDIRSALGYGGASAGTGIVMTAGGQILTNNHVIAGALEISVTLVSNGKSYGATVVGTDATQDIAVLQVNGAPGLTPMQTAGSVSVGDGVVAIGNAGGVGGAPSVVTGTVRALNQTITASDPGGGDEEPLAGLIQTDTPIRPGDSGGPLVNTSAQVVGIDTAASSVNGRYTNSVSVGFAIPINKALDVAKQIATGHGSPSVHFGTTGFLGVSLAPTTSAHNGAVITGVRPGSPAASAGLKTGDTITSLGGQKVDTAEALSAATKKHAPGDKVQITWQDLFGSSHSAFVTLASGPAD